MRKRIFTVIAAVIALAAPIANGAQFDAFLEIEGIKGESRDADHPGTIEVESFSWGVTQQGTFSVPGPVSISKALITARASMASPKLLLTCATGQHIDSAILHVRITSDAGRMTYFKYEFKNVLVSSYSVSSREGGDSLANPPAPASGHVVPCDSFSLNFTKIEFAHQADDGTVTSGSAEASPPQ